MAVKIIRKDFWGLLKNIFLIIIGTLILSFGTSLFIIPFDLVVGGVSSIAIILNKIINIDFITIDLLITVITWLLFFVGLLILGKGFALKTLVSSIVYPIGIALFSRLVDPKVMNGFFCLSRSEYNETAIILAALFGGVLIGTGCAVTFLGGGSTGGVDVLAFIICKFFEKLRSSVIIFIIDAAVIILGMFIIKDLVISLLGIISAFIGAIVIDKLFLGDSKAFIAQVISDKYEDINKEIALKLERTTSIITITGGYSKSEKRMLMVSFSMNQYKELIGLITAIDSNAFITVHRAHEINGEGWTW